ncbi:MAG: hypothetical protein JXK07_07615 [Spirochaetes bacterium]|nr:hypothetical protein [Spirochaetota bacterium]
MKKNRINCGLSFFAQNRHDDNNYSLLKQNRLLITGKFEKLQYSRE